MDDFNPQQGVVEGYEYYKPGRYSVRYQSHEFISPKGLTDRIIIWFAFTDGEYAGEEVPFFCQIKINNRKTGAFSCRRSSKYHKTLIKLTSRKGQRKDRLAPTLLKGLNLTAKVATVLKRQDKSDYSPDDIYSKVESLELQS